MKTRTTKTSNEVTNNICQMVTDKLVSMIEAGVNPWKCPWVKAGASNLAISHTNGKPYSLLNQILLGFRPGEYVTFNQAKKLGGNVKKGAKSEIIVFWQAGGLKPVKSPIKEDDDEEEEEKENSWVAWKNPVLKYYRVFHIDDCEGIEAKYKDVKPIKFEVNTNEIAEETAADYCHRSGVKLNIVESDRAFYSPALDSVTVPMPEQFTEISEYYSTLFHELTHSTGHASRFDRFKDGVFNARKEYSREELVAEIGAATILNQIGINTTESDENSAAYLQGWARFLKDDPRAFVVAAGKAEKAVNLIMNK